ncbi:MAG: hypothetical protein K6E32_09560 [Lachnospiraceae bacterium]|nr:hypothetical protein [Lachnospiraceae bacterium]
MKLKLKEFFSKGHIFNNIGYKIVSLVVAVILWLVVINMTDPMIDRGYRNVPVRLVNASVVTDAGKTIRIIDGTDVIPYVSLRAPRSVIQELGSSPESIVATADFKNLSADGSSVQIEFTTSKYSDKIDSIKSNDDKLMVEIEDRKTLQLPIQYTTSGEIASGYILGRVTLGQNQVRVSGPESVISAIKTASVDVQLTGFTENITTTSDIVFFDSDGDVVSDEELSLNVDSITVSAEILATKKVSIDYSSMGSPAEGYSLTGEIVCEPETVVIAGSTADIAGINRITIPAEALNVTGQTSNLVSVLNLSDYLPDGIRLGDTNNSGKVSITVYIEPLVTETYGIYIRNVEILNVPDGFYAEWDETNDNLELSLKGLNQNLEKLSLSTLNYRVDFLQYASASGTSRFSAGVYKCDLIIDLPNGIEMTQPVKLRVRLIENGGEG